MSELLIPCLGLQPTASNFLSKMISKQCFEFDPDTNVIAVENGALLSFLRMERNKFTPVYVYFCSLCAMP